LEECTSEGVESLSSYWGSKWPLSVSRLQFSGIFGKHSKSTKDLVTLSKDYPTSSEDYDLIEDCGRGVSATVYRSLCKPLHEIVAVKKMNLESMNCDLDEIIHEAQLMKNYNHPNVLPLYTSFVSGQDLWMVMPFISGGSVLHIIKYAYPEVSAWS
jgi:serine/threonine-protein kinase OSR1/STK39